MTDNPYQAPREQDATGLSGPHIVAPVLSCLGTAVLLVALMHVRSDRSKSRQPIVDYVGPFASWMPELAYAGWGLSLLGFVVGAIILSRHREDTTFPTAMISATVAMAIAAITALGSVVAYAGIWED